MVPPQTGSLGVGPGSQTQRSLVGTWWPKKENFIPESLDDLYYCLFS